MSKNSGEAERVRWVAHSNIRRPYLLKYSLTALMLPNLHVMS